MRTHRTALFNCSKCPEMIGPVVSGSPVLSKILLIGQAPGDKEGGFGKPFAWTAGKTMFKWFERIGIDEENFRQRVYMAAVCRCFPGKNPKGGDRVPSPDEIDNCAGWLQAEVDLLKPDLILPVGKLAIVQLMPVKKLDEVIGKLHPVTFHGHHTEAIPLPHPSGASTWHRKEPGITLLESALTILQQHPSWQQLCQDGISDVV
ncbi:uracil-DNA glycosylase family protein [Candidatus Methylobacter oryzae]|uniref:Uracil-DNA glycosylase n=1 Tax=Candidatus Methylobacter oryzae TaxID=2497749 RepID=A0ABY3C4X1_9GAMM|nr:uracil-DNA glycosylase family protein [Candidatus Methylobacter oryzae]TRW89773.1 uracil-DNA glycosylase [Candidatus Methylobacter oryzae]